VHHFEEQDFFFADPLRSEFRARRTAVERQTHEGEGVETVSTTHNTTSPGFALLKVNFASIILQ
jgi:hypothetical protein